MNFFPEQTGVGKYSGEMAFWLSKNHHDVRVIAAPPYYPEWKVHKNFYPWQYKREIVNGTNIVRCPIYVPKNPKGFSRILHLISFAISSMPIIIYQYFWKPDLIITIQPSLLVSPASLILAKISRSKTILHIQDFEIDAALKLGFIPEKLLRFIFSLEKFLLKKFDAISTISQSMKKKLVDKGVKESKNFLFPNWANTNDVFHNKKIGIDFKIKKGFKKDDFLILYSGNMGKKQGLDVAIEAAKALKKYKDIKFIFCGDGADKDNIINLAEKYELKNCFFYPLQNKEDFNAMLNSADVHLVLQKSAAADLVMPSKLTNIIASGGFSLVTAELNTELGDLFYKHNYLGYLIPPNDPLMLEESIQKVKQNKNLIDNLKIRKFAEENFEVNRVMTSFNEQIKNI